MTTQSRANARLIPGQSVVLPGNVFGTVIDFPNEEQVRVCYSKGNASVYYADEIRTRDEALYSAFRLIVRIANDLDDLGLVDAMEQAAVYVERAAQQADAADAVKGLAS